MADALPVHESQTEEDKGQALCAMISDCTVEDSGNSQSADAGLVSSANLSNKSDSITSVSKEKLPKKRPTGRIVPSRFKTAAAASKESRGGNNSSGNKSSNSSDPGSSSNSRNCLNNTLNIGPPNPGKKQIRKTKPVRASQASKSRTVGASAVSWSSSNVPKVASQQVSNVKSHISLPGKKSSHGESAKSSSQQVNKAKLHSTILNATALTDATSMKSSNDVFSTTMVGGMAPSGHKLDLTGVVLPELPDISAIRLDTNSSENRSGDTTVLSSASEKDLSQNSDSSIPQNVTAEELDLEYLSYLQWAYIDISSEAAFNKQVKEAQTQISFLEQLVSKKQLELSEQTQKTDLILHHHQVHEAHKLQTKLLQELVDGLTRCEEAERIMSRELEKNLHQVKIDNLYVPENHKQYRDQILEALQIQTSMLSELESLVEPRSVQLHSTISLLDELNNTAHHIQQCENEVQQAARLAVQEASLHIGTKQMNVSACGGHEDDSTLSLT